MDKIYIPEQYISDYNSDMQCVVLTDYTNTRLVVVNGKGQGMPDKFWKNCHVILKDGIFCIVNAEYTICIQNPHYRFTSKECVNETATILINEINALVTHR